MTSYPDTSIVDFSSDNLKLASLRVGSLVYPSSGPPKAFPISNGSSLVFLSRLIAKTNGTSGVGPGDHITFSTTPLLVGTNISLDSTSAYTTALNVPSLGRITLKPGTYHIRASVLEVGTTAANGVIEASLRNADTGAYFNATGTLAGGTDRCLLTDEAVVVVATQTRIEFTFVFGTTVTAYAKANIDVVQLA